jgi:hypothetical protein
MSEFVDRELSWDDEISRDEKQRTLLPAGNYLFEVEKYERARFQGSAKIPASNMAIVTLKVNDEVEVQERLILHTKMEWKLCSFFASIGMRKKNEPLRMNFDGAIGRHGICKLGQRTYKNSAGVDVVVNQVEQFYYEEESPSLTVPPQQTEAPSYARPNSGQGWTKGSF